MSSTGLHICLETEGAPAREGAFELGSRWICTCGTNFVYREGYHRGGHLGGRAREPSRDLAVGIVELHRLGDHEAGLHVEEADSRTGVLDVARQFVLGRPTVSCTLASLTSAPSLARAVSP